MKTPKGIKIVSLVNYILAIIGIILGIISISGGIMFLVKGEEQIQQAFGGFSGLIQVENFYSLLAFIPIILGVLALIISLLLILTGINLLKGKKWAYLLEIILGIFWIIAWSIELFRGAYLNLILIIPILVILLYLLFNKKAKEYFR